MTEANSDPAGLTQRLHPPSGADSRSGPKSPPDPTACGEFDIRIGRDGTWYYHGSPITRKPLVRLFSTALKREADGSYWLATPVERGRIRVDDAPFTAVAVTATGAGCDQVLNFRTNVDTEVAAGHDHPIRVSEHRETGEPSPYILVRDNLEALIVRSVFYELVALGVEDHAGGDNVLGVWSAGRFFPLGRTE
ncbi:MAG: DUF1285 domain-containing protein [Proteobacteria bacterium]|nr:DUF1285 domain-containing protein [Pseudomonadota bacterium]